MWFSIKTIQIEVHYASFQQSPNYSDDQIKPFSWSVNLIKVSCTFYWKVKRVKKKLASNLDLQEFTK